MLGTFSLVLMAAAPVVSLGAFDGDGCAKGVLVDGVRLSGGPSAFCIRDAVAVHLEGTSLLALRVDAPHRFDARVRSRVFVYRVVAGRLVPRFLGSGFTAREVTRIFPLEGALGVDTISTSAERLTLRCVFDGFPLVCSGAPRTMFKPDPAVHGLPSNMDYFLAQ